MNSLLALLLIIAGAATLRAQPITERVDRRDLDEALRSRLGLIAKPGRDSVVLRWAPSKPGVWRIGNRTGYRVERAPLRPDGRPGEFRPLLDSAVRPWPYERWLAYADAHPLREGASDTADYVAIAYNLLNQFGEDAPARDSYSQDDARAIAERREELEMRYSFALYSVDRSAAAADGLGLRFVDRGVTPGTTYLYRVYLAGSAGDFTIDTGMVTVTAAPPKGIERKGMMADGGEGKVLLRWKANPYYGSYFVERSENGGGTFRRLNIVPITTLRATLPAEEDEEIFLDSTAVNYRPYLYRVYGTTPFAELEMIGEVRGSARDATPPARPFLPNPEHVAARKILVRWTPGEPAAADLAGFRVSRGGTDSGPFTRLTPRMLPPSAREITDTTFNADGTNYYVVEAIDTAGNVSRSNSAYVALIDSTPPGEPRWIDGRMDSNGVVTLRLRANQERDLMGYRLFRANAPDHEFSVIMESFGGEEARSATDTIYRDTVEVRTLTRSVYYRAVALDRNYNESSPSSILTVRRPDLIPPAIPVITDLFVTDTSVQLRYARSSSEDLAYQTVYRRVEGATSWDSIARATAADSIFIDRGVKQSVTYHYALRATDSSGLRSDLSEPVVARPYDPGVRPAVTHLAGRYDSVRNEVRLQWEYGSPAEEYWFVIYRAGDDGQLRRFARVPSRERSFIDREPGGEHALSYAVRVVAASGAESSLGEKIVVDTGR